MDEKRSHIKVSLSYESKVEIFHSKKRKKSSSKGLSIKKVKKLDRQDENSMQVHLDEACAVLKQWETKQDEVNDQHCGIVAKDIAFKSWYVHLGLHLGIPLNDIKIIEEDYKGDVRRIALETLVKWRQLFASNATIYELMKGLKFIERYDLMIKLNDHCLAKFHSK